MSRWLAVLMILSSCAFADLGNEGGHSGDPYVVDFLQRASFALERMKANSFTPSLIEIYEVAYKNLRVTATDETLVTLGRVVPDPQRPGRQYVRLDRARYQQALNQRFTFDLTAFVVHEVFETEGRDFDNQITRDLHFSENEFDQWRRRHPTPITPAAVVTPHGQVIPQAGGAAIVNQYGAAAIPPGNTGTVGPYGTAIAPPGYTIQTGPNGTRIVPISQAPASVTPARPPMPPRNSSEWQYVGREATFENCANRCAYMQYWWWQVGGYAPNNRQYEADGCYCAVRKDLPR